MHLVLVLVGYDIYTAAVYKFESLTYICAVTNTALKRMNPTTEERRPKHYVETKPDWRYNAPGGMQLKQRLRPQQG